MFNAVTRFLAILALADLSACTSVTKPSSMPLASSLNRTYERHTLANREVRIFVYTKYKSDCSPAGDPLIILRSAPLHGVVSFRPESVVVDHSRFGVACIGKVMPGIGVWYTPQDGYLGSDTFNYDVNNGHDTARDAAIINVG